MVVTVDVSFEERYWYPDDGAVVWLAGYQLVNADSGRYLARDAPELQRAALHMASVAGAARPASSSAGLDAQIGSAVSS